MKEIIKMDKNQLLVNATTLGENIKKTNEYIEYIAAKNNFDDNVSLGNKINEFNLEKMFVKNEMDKEDNNEDKIQKHQNRIRELYNEITNDPVYSDFQNKQDALNQLVNDIINELTSTVTGKVQCSGSCESCSGCH